MVDAESAGILPSNATGAPRSRRVRDAANVTPALKNRRNDPDEYDGDGSATICQSPVGARIWPTHELHWAEEALVAAAIAAGKPVYRSPPAPPAAVLGVRVADKVSRAA